MFVEAAHGELLVKFGKRFGSAEAQRLVRVVDEFQPLARVTLDFTEVCEFEDVAIVPLATALAMLSTVPVRVRGLTLHQSRMLRYFGIEVRVRASDGAALAGHVATA